MPPTKKVEDIDLVVKGSRGETTSGWRSEKPVVDEKCTGCKTCERFCPDSAIEVDASTKKAKVDYDYCKGCGICASECPVKAIEMVDEREKS